MDEHLEEKYPDLRNLVQEYHDGILLFEVSLKEVWDKAAKDTAGLEAYFKANKDKYVWEKPHYKGYIIQAKNEKVANAAERIIKNAERDSVDKYIESRLNTDSVKYVKVQYGLWEMGRNKLVDRFGFKLRYAYKPNADYPVVRCVGKKLKAPEAWEDEKGKVTTDYQDYLEAEWVKTLREKYPVEVNKEVWEKIKK